MPTNTTCHLNIYCHEIVPTLEHNSLIVVWADAHTIVLEIESIQAEFGMAELVPEKKHREESKKRIQGETRKRIQ